MENISKSQSIESMSKQMATKKVKRDTTSETQLELQPSCKSLRLKLHIKKNGSVEIVKEVEDVGPQVYFGTGSSFLQSVVLCHILSNHFSLLEQIEMRRVCRLWHYNVKHIWNKEQSLILTLKDKSTKSKMCKFFYNYLKFDYNFDPPTITNNVKISIGKNHWNRATIDLLGDLFRNIEHLTIFYELLDNSENTEKLSYFLQKFIKVKSFSLIMSSCHIMRIDFLSRLFQIINDHLAPLHTLDLNMPHYDNPLPVLKNFHKTLQHLQNFSLNCTVKNLGKILQSIGKSLPNRWPIQSLSINVEHEKSLSLSTLFEQNPKLSQIKRLELTGFEKTKTLNLVFGLLNHFTELEGLYLWAGSIKFTIKWIQTLSKLAHLTELFLWDFKIQIFENCHVKPLPNIRKLTVVLKQGLQYVRDRYYRINGLADDEDVEERLIYAQFLHSFAKQFPSLEQLRIQVFVDLHDEHFSGWCFTEFRHLRSVRLMDYRQDTTFTS